MLVALLLALAGGLLTCSTGDDSDHVAVVDAPIEHQPLTEGWEAVDVPPLDDTYALSAKKQDGDVIARDTSFVLASKRDDLDRDRVHELLLVDPPAEFEVDGGAGHLTLRPTQALRESTRYRFTLISADDGRQVRNWAFQTEGPLRVVQTLPADEASNVPLDTGIEMTFSHDGIARFEDRVTITPAVRGRFELHKRVLVFVPQRLVPETLYTVTVAPGVTVADGGLETREPHTFSFETGSARRQDQLGMSPEGVFFARLVFEASTTEPPSLQIETYSYDEQLSLPFEVYRYADVDAFVEAIDEAVAVPRWTYYSRRNFRLDTSGLEQIATLNGSVRRVSEQYSQQLFTVFPSALDPGFYLVQTQRDGIDAQALLQVTDLASYASLSDPKTLVWVNDLATGAPAADAAIKDADGTTFRTGDDGVAFFDTPDALIPAEGDDAGGRTLRVEHDGRIAVVPLAASQAIGFYGYTYDRSGYDSYYGGRSPDYWSYIYPDRSLYRPSDAIHFWGVAKLRDDFEPGQTLTVRLSGGNYYDSSYRPSLLAETSVQVSDLGTVEGALSFEGAAPGGYQLSIDAGDETIASTYVQVENFIKPAYKIDVVPSRNALFAGENVSVDVSTEFFDGSPVPFVDLAYSPPDGGEQGTITTDADGAASMSYVATAGDPYGGPAYRYASAYPIGPEQGEISGETTFYVLPASLAIDATGDVADGRATITGNVHQVDLAAFDGGDGGSWYEDMRGAPPPGRAISAAVTEITYNEVEVGEYYDFIAKLTRKRYRYDTVERALGTFAATSAADGTYRVGFAVERGKSYRVRIGTTDDAGRLTGVETYVSGDQIPYPTYASDGALSLKETVASGQSPYYATTSYAENDAVDLTVRRLGKPAESGANRRYLFLRARDGILGYHQAFEPRLQWNFAASDIPNVNISAVQFNGRGYESAPGDYVASFDFSDREIELSVTSDAERYEPGDDVTLSIETRDGQGNPVAAEALLSLVDEAIFRAQGWNYEGEMLQQLYQPLSSGLLAVYLPSYTAIEELQSQHGYAPGGAATNPPDTGGPITPRSDFRDLALFRTVRTDAGGNASVTFTLPDNITSWRVTSRAVTGDLRAGAALTALPSGLPFFVEATASDEYLSADRPVIALRAFGSALQSGDAVEYEVSAPSLGANDMLVSGEAFRGVELALPPLQEGEHALTIRARSGDMQDAIVRTISVVTSRLRRGEARFYELTPGFALKGASTGSTQVVFTDNNRGRYYDDLLRLAWGYGDRVDQQLARTLAHDLLRDHFDVDDGPASAFDGAIYQTAEGGIALFPYADDDLLLSARMASTGPGKFGRNGLAQYFLSVLDDPDETRERSIVALFGLAAAGEPVLPSIAAIAAEDDLAPRERLYLGLAALAAGDEVAARQQYREVLLRYAERRAPFVRVRAGVDQDDILELTALAADLGAGLGDPSADEMFAYTQANATEDLLIELEQISYLARALPRLSSAPVRFSYTLDGSGEEQTLEAGRPFALTVSTQQLAQLSPQALEGAVGVATYFEAPFDPASVAIDADINVRRTIDVDGGGISAGDIVEVRLDYALAPQSLDGCYQITDLAPSGLRPITRANRPYEGSNVVTPYRIDGQRVSFCVYRESDYVAAVYLARVVTTGDYLAEPAIIQSQLSAESFNFAPASSVAIR